MQRRRRLLAWSVPAALAVAVAAVAAVPKLVPAGADPVPNLPDITPAQLLVKAATANVSTFSGHVTLDANLGLPDLGSFGVMDGTGLDLLSGSHTASVWADGPQHVRVEMDAPAAENDWIRNGTDLWAWNSRDQSVTHATVPADSAAGADSAVPTPPTPDQLAQDLLAKVDPSTAVSVRTPAFVAGRPVYELVLTPRSANSTVQEVTLAVDAATGLALDAKVVAKSTATPALEVGFSDISFDQPPASEFDFTPPPGATVTEATGPLALLGLGGARGDRDGGTGEIHSQVRPPKGTPAPATPTTGTATTASHDVTVIGQAWDAVVIARNLPMAGPLAGIVGNGQAVTTPGGAGRLITTNLVNVIVLDDGRVAVGAVTPEALAAAVPAS
jgi:outer membrane lipoprotein-sorting protein